MTYDKEIDEKANKKGKTVRIMRFLPASKVKMQAGWKEKWKRWLAFGKPSCFGIGVPYLSFCSLISQKGIIGFQETMSS